MSALPGLPLSLTLGYIASGGLFGMGVNTFTMLGNFKAGATTGIAIVDASRALSFSAAALALNRC